MKDHQRGASFTLEPVKCASLMMRLSLLFSHIETEIVKKRLLDASHAFQKKRKTSRLKKWNDGVRMRVGCRHATHMQTLSSER